MTRQGSGTRLVTSLAALLALLAAPLAAQGAPEELLVTGGEVGKRGGRLVAALASEPQTFNPLVALDAASLAVADMTTADLIHVNRHSQQTEPALARAWKVADGGRRYTLELRRGLRFSDGHPFDADDVVFSLEAYLDEKVASPQRDLLVVGGRPVTVRKVDDQTVVVELAEPYAAAERLFDGLAILPRHLLAERQERGELAAAWGPGTPPERMAGLGPFRLAEHRPGERLVLERNPYYWKQDAAGERLPYLDRLAFIIVPSQDAQVLRFQAGDLDVIDRLSADSFELLARQAESRGYRLVDVGAGLDYNFLFFNLNPVDAGKLPAVARRQSWFRQTCFRQAVSAAADRQGIVRLVYGNRAAPLATLVTPGHRHWVDRTLAPPERSLERARALLAGCGFRRDPQGALVDREGQRVKLTILTVAASSQRRRMATVIQQDLEQLGMEVRIAALELSAVLERLFQSHDYDACILGLGSGDTDPNTAMNVLLSNGSHHLWHLGQSAPATAWEAEIDRLMRRQLTTLDRATRKNLYDRVQRILAEQEPLISLVSPNVLAGAKAALGNFRPAVLDPSTLWNVEELFWR